MPVVELLVTRSKVNIKAVSNDMLTPLLCAMINNRPLVSSFLIHHEPGLLSIPDSNGDFPLHFAVLEGLADMVSSIPSLLPPSFSFSFSLSPNFSFFSSLYLYLCGMECFMHLCASGCLGCTKHSCLGFHVSCFMHLFASDWPVNPTPMILIHHCSHCAQNRKPQFMFELQAIFPPHGPHHPVFPKS